MGVQIKAGTEPDTYWVNDKYVYKDASENWIANTPLSPEEKVAFRKRNTQD